MESKIQHELVCEAEIDLTCRENRLVVAKGEGDGGGMDWECGISRCKLLYIEWLKNQDSIVKYRKLYSISCDKL